jgi:5-methylcytosine-specific restriction endonuclease McrA
MSNFENSLTVDFVHPRAHRGKKAPANLVTSCRPCNIIKGRRMFSSLEEAKAYVLQRRLELKREWEANTARLRSQSAALSL